jgi:CDP-paratose 2-epimerase
MKTVIVTGAGGLVGSESVAFFAVRGFNVVGIDDDSRAYFFGEEASVKWSIQRLTETYKNFRNFHVDIRDFTSLSAIFKEYSSDIDLIIHAAAQPSHDWAAKEPFTDFSINATGTLNLLEATRLFCPEAVFIFTSTNKVYGDTPNFLPLAELETRWEVEEAHPYFANGIDENMSIDQSKHSLYGASKVAADVMVQEYGRYFNIKTGVFRGGCLTGPNHSGAELHGFLAYLMKCAITGKEYTIFGYKGKQVRDNIHCADLVDMFWHFYQFPRPGEVYNAGGGRFSNCSMLEAITLCEKITGKKMNTGYFENNRIGDHIWYISDLTKFKNHYPAWQQKWDIPMILEDLFSGIIHRIK